MNGMIQWCRERKGFPKLKLWSWRKKKVSGPSEVWKQKIKMSVIDELHLELGVEFSKSWVAQLEIATGLVLFSKLSEQVLF